MSIDELPVDAISVYVCWSRWTLYYDSGEEQYRDADKSLARPGRKQAQKHVRNARNFNNIETRAVIKFFPPARQGAEGNSRHSDRNISLFPFLVSLKTYDHPCNCAQWITGSERRYISVKREGNLKEDKVQSGQTDVKIKGNSLSIKH